MRGSKYPDGFAKVSRRTLLGSLPALAMAPYVLGQDRSAAIQVQKLNCFELRVSNVPRTVAFYQDLFGMPVQARYGQRVCLRIGEGPQFMAVRPTLPEEQPAITQIGYSVANFDLDDLSATLGRLGYEQTDPPPVSAPGIDNAMKTWIRMRGDTPELYFADPRGLIVQLTDPGYCGGSGPLGDMCPAPEATPDGLMDLSDINHFTAFVSDGAGANTYYQDIFGLSVQSYQGPNSPVTGIGDGYQFVMYAGGGTADGATPANIHHGCFNMTGFDVDRILAMLTEYGLSDRGDGQAGPMMHYISLRMPERGGAEGGTPELYFTDPDGILMQLQDVSYCGGGGYLGNECLEA